MAWQALGEHAKAVGYFERALTIIEKKLGAENPNTRTIRGNLAAARAGLSGTGAAGPGRAP